MQFLANTPHSLYMLEIMIYGLKSKIVHQKASLEEGHNYLVTYLC